MTERTDLPHQSTATAQESHRPVITVQCPYCGWVWWAIIDAVTGGAHYCNGGAIRILRPEGH